MQLISAIRGDKGVGVYWHTFGKTYGNEKCYARQVTTLCGGAAAVMPYFAYCDGAGRMDYSSLGQADPYYAGFTKHLSWCSEPQIGRIPFAGPTRWRVAYDLTATVPAAAVAGRQITVRAVDFFKNFSEPSDPAKAKQARPAEPDLHARRALPGVGGAWYHGQAVRCHLYRAAQPPTARGPG